MSVYTIPYQDKYIVYRPLKKLAFIANAALVNLIAQAQGNLQKCMSNERHKEALQFLESIGFWEPDPFSPPPPSGDRSFQPTIATLFLTTACNLRCIYCYASGGDNYVQTLSAATGRRAIDLVCRNAGDTGQGTFELSFHGGGEPTLAGTAFKELVQYAKAKELPCKISVASNGYWNADEREWMLDHLDSISLSCDGIQSVQDRQRPLASGQGTFETVLKTIHALDQRQFPYGIRLTVTNESIDELAHSIEFLCAETACRAFQVEPAFNHGRAQHDGTALTNNERFAAAFLEAYDIARSFDRHLYYSGARPWIMTSRFCQAPERALVVTPNGLLTACYEIYSENHALAGDFIFGTLSDSGALEIDFEARQTFFTKLQDRRVQCEDCFCYWHCAGDCPSKTFSPDNGGHLHFGERCELNRLITKELLLRYIAGGNGIWQGAL